MADGGGAPPTLADDAVGGDAEVPSVPLARVRDSMGVRERLRTAWDQEPAAAATLLEERRSAAVRAGADSAPKAAKRRRGVDEVDEVPASKVVRPEAAATPAASRSRSRPGVRRGLLPVPQQVMRAVRATDGRLAMRWDQAPAADVSVGLGGGGDGGGGGGEAVVAGTTAKVGMAPNMRQRHPTVRVAARRSQPAAKFVHGNYDRYYGYRAGMPKSDSTQSYKGLWADPRVALLDKAWFRGKDCLDIGCNAGYISIQMADQFECSLVVGVDIDSKLVNRARKVLRQRARERAVDPSLAAAPVDALLSTARRDISVGVSEIESLGTHRLDTPEAECQTPASVARIQGLTTSIPPVTSRPAPRGEPGLFPHNVVFRCEDFLVGNDMDATYDVITCFSVTKWVHLNHGDDGVRRLLRRVYRLLRPGGRFILEAQDWQSYKKRKSLTPTIASNFGTIRLMPDRFAGYLLKDVGFASCEKLGTPMHKKKGFQRPVLVLQKAPAA